MCHPSITVEQITITGLHLKRTVISALINDRLPKEDKTLETRTRDHVSVRLDHLMTLAAHNSLRLYNPTGADHHREVLSSMDPGPVMAEANLRYKKEEETNPTLSCLEKRLSRNTFHAKKSQS